MKETLWDQRETICHQTDTHNELGNEITGGTVNY